jgi:biopolymer transport protein ExbD
MTLRKRVEPTWYGADFIAPGAKLPEAVLGTKPPSAPVIHVSSRWVKSRGKRVAKAREIIADPDYVVDGLYEELISIAEELRASHDYDGVSDIACDIIIQADREVEFELLTPVLYTCACAGYGRWNFVAVNNETGELETVTLEQPVGRDAVVACSDGTGVTLIERGDTVAVKYKPIEIVRPLYKYDLVLYVGDDWFLLPDRGDGATVGVRNIADYGYFILWDKFLEIKRRHPKYKSLIIACDGRVKYGELIHIIEISVQPEIAMTEIYLSRINRRPR